MKYSLRILSAADADLDAAAFHIARDSSKQALRFLDAVEKTYRRIRERPLLCAAAPFAHPALRTVRRCPVAGFRNHLVFFRLDAQTVEVIRILHGARDIRRVLLDDLQD